MTNTLLHLQKKLPDNIVDIFRAIADATSRMGIKAFVIGATARDLVFEYVYNANIRRKTEDVDFGIAVGSWKEYEKLKTALTGSKKFRQDTRQEQRIWWTGPPYEMRVDLVPYGGLESMPGKIAFPPSGAFTMSTLGFREASEDLLRLEVAEDLIVHIVSPAGLALLKLIAYHDRPAERRRDIQDIWFVAFNYLSVGNEDRLYSTDADLLEEEDFDLRKVGARLLGRDLGRLLTEETRKIVRDLLEDEVNGGGAGKLADIINKYEVPGGDRYDEIILTLTELRRGINEPPFYK